MCLGIRSIVTSVMARYTSPVRDPVTMLFLFLSNVFSSAFGSMIIARPPQVFSVAQVF